MSLKLLKRKSLFFLYGAGIVLLAIAGWIWWSNVSMKPERVFWDMISQSLSTSGVTVQSSQDNNGTSVKQTVQFSFSAQNQSHSLTTLTQTGTTVVDEMIATPTADYTRYLSVKTDQKGKDGKPLNLSNIIGVWAKREGPGQLFAQHVLGTGMPLGGVAVPMANLNSDLRAKAVQQIKNQGVYQISFAAAKKEHLNGRLVFIYDAKVQPVVYANMMKNLSKNIGLHDLDQLDPNSFANQPAFEMRLTVDAHSRQLVTAEGVSAGIKQTYTSYDMPVTIALPAKPITGTELQDRLTKLQQ
ncbi:MAG TPA: hypothetical protein VLH86_05650 [Patescibacteria group bacterium]|nr:hypothetical protein [Patescibacteria group bacterium]